MLTPSTGAERTLADPAGQAPVAAVEPLARRASRRGDHLGAVVVEAHPVDDRAVGREPEQPGPVVAGLWPGGDGADLDEPEAERAEGVDPDRVLVEAGGQAERVGEGQPHGGHRRRRGVDEGRWSGAGPRGSPGSRGRWARSGSTRVKTPVEERVVAVNAHGGPVLQRAHADVAADACLDALDGGAEPLDGRDAGDVGADGSGPDLVAVDAHRAAAARRAVRGVHDEGDLAARR